MRLRVLVVCGAVAMLAGCGGATGPRSAGRTARPAGSAAPPGPPGATARPSGSPGTSLVREGSVGGLTYPEAASFLSPQLGWVVGIVSHYSATGVTRREQRIVVTDDGGRTWRTQYTSPLG